MLYLTPGSERRICCYVLLLLTITETTSLFVTIQFCGAKRFYSRFRSDSGLSQLNLSTALMTVENDDSSEQMKENEQQLSMKKMLLIKQRKENLEISSNQQNFLPKSHHLSFTPTTPYNYDISRSLFPTLFFSLYHNRNIFSDKEQNLMNTENEFTRLHRQCRPSPFENPSSAQTVEKMLRRMIDNRYRSGGRTVCPDARTFELVAGAFGRLRYPSKWRQTLQKFTIVTWEEERKSNQHFPWKEFNHSNDQAVSIDHHVRFTKNNKKVLMNPANKLQELLILQLQLCHYEGWPLALRPGVSMYNRMLKRLSCHSGISNCIIAEQAMKWLYLMQSPMPKNLRVNRCDSAVCPPDAMTLAYVIRALSSPPQRNALSLKNQHVLEGDFDSVENLCEELNLDVYFVTNSSSQSKEWFLNEAERLLDDLKKQHYEGSKASLSKVNSLQLLTQSYEDLVEGWAQYAIFYNSTMDFYDDSRLTMDQSKSNNIVHSKIKRNVQQDAIIRAHNLLLCLEHLVNLENIELLIPSSCYLSVISALSISTAPSAAHQAEEMLIRMMRHYGIHKPIPSSINKNFIIPMQLNPKDISAAYSACIAAYVTNNDAKKAETMLRQMIDLYDSGKLGSEFVPEERAYGICISAWIKHGCINGLHTKANNTPSVECIENSDRAEMILSELEKLSIEEKARGNSGIRLHATTYNMILHARAQMKGKSKKSFRSKSNFSSKAYDDENAILHAMSLLDHMEYKMNVSPDAYTYSILLNAWMQRSHPGHHIAADRAEALLKRMINSANGKMTHPQNYTSARLKDHEFKCNHLWPNEKHYSIVLKAHAQTKSARGAKKALAILNEMNRRHLVTYEVENNGNTNRHVLMNRSVPKPDLVCYSIVIDAFANSRLPEASMMAHRLLGILEAKYDSGDISMKPNTRIYTAVIQTLIYSQTENNFGTDENISSQQGMSNAQLAWSLLERMKNHDVSPNTFTYNFIINCAAECKSKESELLQSFKIALKAFQELREGSDNTNVEIYHPDSFTYAFMLKACNNLLPRGSYLRKKVVTHTFRECCSKGYLTDAVLDRLRNVLSSEIEFHKMIGINPTRPTGQRESSMVLNELPKSWSRNVGKSLHGKTAEGQVRL